jgi:hypothetical protein
MENITAIPGAARAVPISVAAWPRYRIVYACLGLLLLVAALLKAQQLATSPLPPTNWLSPRAMIFLVQGELFLGTWLLLDVVSRGLWWVSVSGFAAFALVSLQKALLGYASCGCFGRMEISPWWTLLLDLSAVAALLKWRPPTELAAQAAPLTGRSRTARRGLWAVLIYAAMGVPIGLAIVNYQPQRLTPGLQMLKGSEVVLLEPETWRDLEFPLLPYIEGGQRLRSGRWIVVLFHHDCPKCQEVLPSYQAMAAAEGHGQANQVAFVELPPFAGESRNMGSSCFWARLSDHYEWFVTTPLELQLDEGIVKAVVPDGLRTDDLARWEAQ